MNSIKTILTSGLIGWSIIAAFPVSADVTGLRADIYSATTAELFWDRVPNEILSFEILRDDGEQNTTDGTSFFDSNRMPGTINTYTVTAIDAQGVRSEPLSLVVGSFGSDRPQVTHLRGDVYSSTAAELFWIKEPGNLCTFEVVRDDGVTNIVSGDSYYDEYREPGVANTYTVTAIDENGNRSLPTSIKLAPFGYETINSPPATGLRASVYSSVALELHWDRVPNRNLRYEILRNDGYSNVTNGTSYYDNRRVPGADNTYIITTIDEEGNRSSPVSIDVPGA